MAGAQEGDRVERNAVKDDRLPDKRRMRVMLITGSFPPMRCGVGDYTARLAEALGGRDDMSVAVLTSRETGSAKTPDGNYEVFPVVKKWKLSEFMRIVGVVRRWRPDIVHIQFPTQGYSNGLLPWLLPALLFLFNVKVAQTWHEYYITWRLRCLSIPKALVPGGLIVVRQDYKAGMPSFYRRLFRHREFRFISNASALPRVVLSPQERLALRERFAPAGKSLLVYFGFIYPNKGVELLFEIAVPEKHHIVLVGYFNEAEPYHKAIMERVRQGRWAGKVTVAGFLPPEEAARILAAADAVILPFLGGGGAWNTSLHGAALQGTFVLTTSGERHGYDALENIYYARRDDVEDMREALRLFAGKKNSSENISRLVTWDFIADEHVRLYKTLLGQGEKRHE